MRITFVTRKFGNVERNSHCDVLHITPIRVARLLLDCNGDMAYSRCQSLKTSLVFLNRASYGRRRNNDVTSQELEVTMMLRHNLRTDAQMCGKSATQASLFVRHGRGVNRVYWVSSSCLIGEAGFLFPRDLMIRARYRSLEKVVYMFTTEMKVTGPAGQ